MKTTGRYIIAAIAVLFSISMSFNASAGCHGDNGWQERMKAERVAYLTTAMNLTPAEAEKFWPVYNNMENERRASFGKVMKAYRALDEGIKAGKTEKEISVLLNAYMTAVKNSRAVESKYVPMFTKILSVEKVAKLFIGEEEFRRQKIGHWNAGKPSPEPREK